ncbi:MAG TPA: phospholipase D-like domain-containing protein [Candidatus Saccharimonadales bacterium]|nr:phospholipase D-like domain-containing protein [Candidatus Saccharimonadales bacterium]
MKKYLPLLILIVLVYAWYFFIHQQSRPTKVNVLGANTNLQLYIQPDAGQAPLLDAIDSAKREILVEVYLLSDKQIISALEDAHSRGVDVKVMLEEHPFGGGSLNKKTTSQLDAQGIPTEWSDPAFTLTHEKSITIDGAETFVLSQNLTASSFSKNREYDILDTNPADVTEVRTIFIDDWERKSFAPPQNSNIIESPDNSRTALTTLIDGSTTSIEAETEDINDERLVETLSEKAKTMQVRLIVPTIKQLESNKSSLEELSAAGVHVRTISSPYMHAKMILSDDKKAYIGSINFSTQSMDQNRELGIILTQQDDLQMLQTTFDNDWYRATDFSN